jgi:thiamine biosynthesis lipoprotein
MPPTSRRRFLAISAAAAAGLAGSARAELPLTTWRGQALGAVASITLAHPDGTVAKRLLAACVAEIDRLETIFSLYRTDSAISRLNAEGTLDVPPLELVELLGRCARFSELTGGTFDVSVQPLFRRYADHFARPDADPAGPEVDDALALVGWQGVTLRPDRVAFEYPGMAITLNGIAQGYITDRVAGLLRAQGMSDVLVDLGELRALGLHPSGRPWRVGVRRPGWDEAPATALDLAHGALAVSCGAGSPFETSGRLNHLLDPGTGRSADPARLVCVRAPDATMADALSTAFALMPKARAHVVADRLPDVRLMFLPG